MDQLGEILDRIDVVVRRRRDQADAGGRVAHPGDLLVDLVTRQLAAFARLRALGHLDLDVVGVDQVLGGDAEAAGRHLLDCRALRIPRAVRQRVEALRFLAALAGIRLAADAVHRLGQGRVGLVGDRAERHRAGREALDDFLRRLDFLQRQRLIGEVEFEQAAQRQQPLVLLIDQLRVFGVGPGIVAAHRVLQLADRLRRPDVVLAAQAEGIIAPDVEVPTVDLGVAERIMVPSHRLARDLVQPDTLDGRRGPGEVPLDKRGRQTDGIEDLCAAIRLVGRDPHLRHDLEQALADRLDVTLPRLFDRRRIVERRQQRLDGVECQIRVDGLGAIAGQRRKVMHLERRPGLDHDAGVGAQTAADQVMVHGRGRQQGRDGDVVGIDRAVGQDQDVVVIAHGLLGRLAKGLKRRRHTRLALGRRIGDAQRTGPEALAVVLDVADPLEVLVGQHRLVHLQPHVLPAGIQAEQVRAGTDQRDQRHHDLFADRVDRWVRDLREQLLEVVRQVLRPARQHRRRVVRAHRADRLLAGQHHRRQQELDVLLGVAERLLAVQQGLGIGRHGADHVRQVVQADLGLVEPVLVGLGGRQRRLDLGVVDDPTLLHVDQEHLAGLQAPLLDDGVLGDLEHAHLRAHHHQVVIGDQVAGRPQAVAIERRADLAAIGEGDGGRTVPGFHHRGVVFVEGAPLPIHQRVAGPGLRNQHHHRVRQRITARHQQFQGVVEARRIRLPLRNQRPDLVEILAEDLGRHRLAARRHPVDVAAQGVDLAVVRDHAKRVGQVPGREGVGREALMHQRQRGDHAFVVQVLVVLADLRRQQHALVDDCARRERGEIERLLALQRHLADPVLDLLADHEQLALEGILVGTLVTAADEHLADHRLGRQHAVTQSAVIDRDVTPAQQALPLEGDEALDDLLRLVPGLFVPWQEQHADGVLALRRQLESDHPAKEPIRDLQQQPGPVSGARISADRTTMMKTLEYGQAMPNDRVTLLTLDMRDKPDAAGVVLVRRVVQAVSRRQCIVSHRVPRSDSRRHQARHLGAHRLAAPGASFCVWGFDAAAIARQPLRHVPICRLADHPECCCMRRAIRGTGLGGYGRSDRRGYFNRGRPTSFGVTGRPGPTLGLTRLLVDSARRRDRFEGSRPDAGAGQGRR